MYKLVEDHSLTEIVAKLISIRKKNIDNINLFLNPKIKNLLPNPSSLKDMNIDEKRCLVIPSQFAYGNRKIGNIIKPNSTLIFEVKLLNIVKTQ